MKRVAIFALVALTVLFASCNVDRKISNKGIPERVSHVKFWNGGGIVFEAEGDVRIAYRISTVEKIVGASIYFYTYEVTVNGETTYIIDSEALTFIYKLN